MAQSAVKTRSPHMVKHTLNSMPQSFPSWVYLPKRNENVCPYQDTGKNVPGSFILNSPQQ